MAVSSFDELFLASKAESYRSSDLSQVGEKTRKTILLTQNVSMIADLEITADVNLDLGGFDLITNGHSLTFRHSYYGSLAVKNGRLVVTASGGYVYADVPNAAVYFDRVTAGTKEGETFTETADTRLIATATSPYFTAYNSLRRLRRRSRTKLAAVKDALGLTFTDKDGNVTALTAVTKTATLSDGGTDYTLTYLSFSDSLGTLLSSSAALAEQVRSGKAYYTITIDPGKIPLDNTDVRLVYEFKTGVTASVWSVYSSFSEFVLPVVIKYGTHVTDPNFYVWLCNVTSDSGETISNPADGILYSDKLKLNVPLDYANSTDTFLRAVTDFTGVKYMDGTQKLNLSGATVSSSVIEEIAQMSSVASIDLSDCSITIAANATNPFAVWGDPSVSKLTNLTTLHLESNTIYSFGWLEPLCSTVARSLTSVYLSGNVPSPTSSASADNVFYGSDGLNNYGTYLELVSAGISVYSGGTKDSPVTFADSRSSSPVYLAMRNLTYQNKLPAGVTVENLLDSFSTTPSHYGLGLTAKNATYSCSLSSVTLSFAKVNETTFSMTYTARVSGGATYTVTLKYSVTLA